MESEIWETIRKGDSEAMKTLYKSCYHELYAFGFRVSSDKEQVKDNIHEIFCELWQKRATLSHVTNVKAYLKTYLKRKLLKDLIANSQFSEISEISNNHIQLQEYSYEYLLIQNQTSDLEKSKMYNALDQLTPSQKEIIQLKFFEGLSYEQISIVLKIQPRTAYNHVFEGLLTLRKLLK